LTIIGLLAKHKIFRVSLNLVLDHNLTFGHTKFFWSFSQPRSLTRKEKKKNKNRKKKRALVKRKKKENQSTAKFKNIYNK
jgi:hypothetical protein